MFSLCLQSERLVHYHMEFSGIDPDSQKPKLIDSDGKFSKAVSILQHNVAQCFDKRGPCGIVVGTGRNLPGLTEKLSCFDKMSC